MCLKNYWFFFNSPFVGQKMIRDKIAKVQMKDRANIHAFDVNSPIKRGEVLYKFKFFKEVTIFSTMPM